MNRVLLVLLVVLTVLYSVVQCDVVVDQKTEEVTPPHRRHAAHHHRRYHKKKQAAAEYEVHEAGAQMQMNNPQYPYNGQYQFPYSSNNQNQMPPPSNNQNNPYVNNGFAGENANNRPAANYRLSMPRSNNPDNWDRIPYLFQTYNEPELPEKYYQMPLLSNGFIGTRAFNDSIYVNGLYNGRNERSHRLRIPSMSAVEAYFDPQVTQPVTTYTLDCRRGVYVKEMRIPNANLYQRYYVHRLRNILVNEIKVELLNNAESQVVDLLNITTLIFDPVSTYNLINNPNRYSNFYQPNDPEDMMYEQRVIRQPTMLSKGQVANDGVYHLRANIPEPELDNKIRKDIHIIYTNIPLKLYVYRNQTIRTFHLITAVDKDFFKAQSAFDDAMRTIQADPNGLYQSHIMAWEDIWQKNGMAMAGESNVFLSATQDDFKVAQRLYASFYNLYSSLPAKLNWAADSQFYGLSPAGLGYGALRQEFYNTTTNTILQGRQFAEGYGGHVTYHQDFWIMPIVSMFSQDMSKSIIQSRLRRGLNTDHVNILDQARDNAKEDNAQGVRYANYQGDFGKDLSSSQDVRKKRIYTSGAVGFGLRSYLRMSHDRDFVLNSISPEAGIKGEDLVDEVAKYYNSKLKLSTNRNMYEINDVVFGDHSILRDCNNEAFTNYLAKVSLDSYQYSLRLADKDPYNTANSFKTKDYKEKVDKLYLPIDSGRRLYLEFDGFNSGQQNSETWVPYLNYPLQMVLDYGEKKTLLDTYSQQVANDGRHTMTYASLVAGYLEINEENRARDYFNRLSNHFNGPFLVMSEFSSSVTNPSNTYNYLPGYASYLHAFIGGYCGVRVKDYQIDIVYPSMKFNDYTSAAPSSSQTLPIKTPFPSLDYWNITGLSYRGFEIDIIFNLRAKQLVVRNRRLTEGFTLFSTKSLEVIFYEYERRSFKNLNVGESHTFNINPALWEQTVVKRRTTTTVRPRVNDDYSNNIDVLLTIFPTQFRDYIDIDSGAGGLKYVNSLFISLIISSLFVFY